MIRRLGSYAGFAYRSVLIPHTVFWAVGLTALFACVTGAVNQWRPDAGLLVTAGTLVVYMLLMRALDDVMDYDYDRKVNPGRPLPSGMVRRRDLLAMIAVGCALVLLLNAGRGVALIVLAVQMAYTAIVVCLDMFAGWPGRDRMGLQLAVNTPIQPLLSLYVYAGFLRAQHLAPSAAGFVAVAAVTAAAVCLEFGRKATWRPKPGERSYVTVLGPARTSLAAFSAAVMATVIVLVMLAPWHRGAWGWLVLAPLALPALAAARFAAGAVRWPAVPTIAYIPAMYASFLAVGWITKGAFG